MGIGNLILRSKKILFGEIIGEFTNDEKFIIFVTNYPNRN